MRKSLIEQIKELIKLMRDLHQVLLEEENPDNIVSYLGECQNAAIAIGEYIEKHEPKALKAVELLEQYCEEVFLLSGGDGVREEHVSVLEDYLQQTEQMISLIPATYHVAFFPYKVEMWDSLESIWRACKEDAGCECFVVPLPYAECNKVSKRWEPRYDGGLFSPEVSVVDYHDYSLEANCPDIAYIHNPYDGSNYVTSVLPEYYSPELKKYVKKLVYVPYFVTAGMFPRGYFPVYHYMDYMIIQAPFVKEYFSGVSMKGELLALGSPKFDCVVQACKRGGDMPPDWRTILGGKKVLMLNTSIGCLLYDQSHLLRKLRYLFELFAQQDKAALIWRPHPLLEATIKSMRTNLLKEYESLMAYFSENRIGILDRTSNIENTIALSDGYLGEESTSVVNLFMAAEKPVFILNNYITERFSQEEKRRVQIWDMACAEGQVWAVAYKYNALLYLDKDAMQFRFAGRLDNQVKWCGVCASLAAQGESLYFSPYAAAYPAVYQMKRHEFQSILPAQDKEMLYGKVIPYKDKLFYLPYANGPILEYRAGTKMWKRHLNPITGLVGNEIGTIFPITFEYAVSGAYLWIPAAYTNRVLQFNMDSGTYVLHQIGGAGNAYSGIAVDGANIWLAESHSGDVMRWNRHTKKLKVFSMPPEFRSRKTREGIELAHMALVDMGQWIITVPWLSNGTARIEKETGKVAMIATEFWKDVDLPANNYLPELHASVSCYYKQDKATLMVQRMTDGAAALINVEEDTYEQFYPSLTDEDYEKLIEGEDGFEQRSREYGFFRRESPIFTLEGFMDELVNGRLEGVKERQREALEHIAVNSDGTCGEKVHQYMMEVLSS